MKLFGRQELKRVLFVPDTHAPYHDKKAWALMIQVARDLTFDTCALLGDFYDCNAVSSYTKDPEKLSQFQDELDAARPCLDDLDELAFKRKIVTLGNHEQRAKENCKAKAPEYYKLIMKGDLFGFKRGGWEVYDYREHAKIGKVIVTHDVAANGALAVLNAVQDNVVTGHDHQINYVIRGTATGTMHVSATFGWLGDVKAAADYMHNLKAQRQWALGFGIGYMKPDGTMFLQPVPIVNYECCVEGKLYR